MPFRRARLFVLPLGVLACRGTEPFVPMATSIAVTPGALSFGTLGRVRALTAVVLDQRGDTIPGPSVQWSTGNGSVVSVDAVGHVTALGVGTTQVYASAQGSSLQIRDSVAVTVTQVPAALVKVGGDQQLDSASGTLPEAITVLVDDSLAHPVPGIVVSFAVTEGGGNLSAAADTTDALGRAAVVWTLGPAFGANALQATVAGTGIGANPATFAATAVPAGSRSSVVAIAGQGQTGLAGSTVNEPPAVIVLDPAGRPIAGKAVDFVVSAGGGSVQGGSAVTDANGAARVAAWSLTLGANSLTATVQDTGIVGNPIVFTATGATAAYHIEVRFLVSTTPARQAAFTAAASRWESIIFGDVPDVVLNRSTVCGEAEAVSTVDDILILAVLDSIDGPGDILGQAAPCIIRSGSHLPVVGFMEFDTADVASLESSGLFGLVIEHEMGHVLGFGTVWGSLLVGAGGSDPHLVGAQGLAAFDRNGGLDYTLGAKVPVENAGQAGTRDAHWRETVFKKELMTGFINSGANPLSVVTTASMGDLGYLVNYAASDVFSVTAAPPAAAREVMLPLGDDIRRAPIEEVDAAGRVIRVIPPR